MFLIQVVSPSEVAIQWFKDNFMKANASKFQALCVSRDINPPILELCIDGVVIRSELHVKLLGVHIDQRLSFNYHITEMCKKDIHQTRAQACLSGMLNVESKFLIFYAFVVSNFMYCPLVWHMFSVSDSKKVKKIQERALRYVLTHTVIFAKSIKRYIIPITFKNFSHKNI